MATPGNFFLDPHDYAVHRVLRAIDRNTALSRLAAQNLAPQDAWLATAQEYHRRFEMIPEALTGAEIIAERCRFTGPPARTVFPTWPDPQGQPAALLLRQEAYQGARRRYGDDLSEEVVERLEYELQRITDKGFADYFLVVQDIVRRSPRICGRGSAAASLVAYCLGITNVCPLKHHLYFERFLNPGRTDPPDIDVDFAWDERDQVIATVLEQYRQQAALVCTQVLFQPRMAIREVAKVFGLTDREIDQVARRLPWFWQEDGSSASFQAQLEALPEMKALTFPDPWPAILQFAQQIIGTPRYLSVHPGGVVITPQPIADYAPVERAPKGVPIVQWEKDSGLVKIDLLGNRSLAAIRDTLANIRANGVPFDEAK